MSEPWLIRIPEVFQHWEAEILRDLRLESVRRMGKDYHLVRGPGASADMVDHPAAKFLSWKQPVHHSWPCKPEDQEGFVEKAAQALWRKFGPADPQALWFSALDPGAANRYYRLMASNLRGRALQLFPAEVAAVRDAETQQPRTPSLFGFVGSEGLFAGVIDPLTAGGFYPGGTRFIRQNAPETISRAGAKIAEALHHLGLHRPCPAAGAHWLELGASPGGMTAELLARGYHVTAVDRAPLDVRLNRAEGLRAIIGDVASFVPSANTRYDAVLSDMNGDAVAAMRQVARLAKFVKPGGLVVFTLKLAGATDYDEVGRLDAEVLEVAQQAGLRLMRRSHLTYNRMEFTCWFEVPEIR